MGYETKAIGPADDTIDADGVTVFDFWQAQDQSRIWAEQQRLTAAGIIRTGPYKVEDAVNDYLSGMAAEKKPAAVKGAKYVFDAWILPDLGPLLVDELTTEKLTRWRNKIATDPKRVRSRRGATKPATRETPDDEDARRDSFDWVHAELRYLTTIVADTGDGGPQPTLLCAATLNW